MQEAGQKKAHLEVSWLEREELPVPHRIQNVSSNQEFNSLIYIYHGSSSIHAHVCEKEIEIITQIYHKGKNKNIIEKKVRCKP